VRATNHGPYTLSGTNSWIVGRNPAYVIDPGPADATHAAAVCDELERRGGAAAILLTHDHSDHSGAVGLVRARTGAPLAAMRAGADIELVDGVRVGPLETIATPGHADDHAAFLHDGVCFTGDLVLGEGSVFVAPGRGLLAAYLASLQRLRELPLELIAPGHGPLVTDPTAKLDEYLARRLERERQLVAALADGVRDRGELLERLWPELPDELRPAAAATLDAHLGKLADEGQLPESVS